MIPSANEEGGSRDKRVLYPNLAVISRIPDGTCVFIDDVASSGGHLIAAAWKLAESGRDVSISIVLRVYDARTIDPFSVPRKNSRYIALEWNRQIHRYGEIKRLIPFN